MPIAVQAMECGKHAAIEVPRAVTLAECWQMVDTSERTRKHCMILENCCYEYAEMLVLNMIRGASSGRSPTARAPTSTTCATACCPSEGEGLWRRFPHIDRNGNHYPTHGLGPVAWYMNINRGDRFTRLVSMSSQPAALPAARRDPAADDPRRRRSTPAAT